MVFTVRRYPTSAGVGLIELCSTSDGVHLIEVFNFCKRPPYMYDQLGVHHIGVFNKSGIGKYFFRCMLSL